MSYTSCSTLNLVRASGRQGFNRQLLFLNGDLPGGMRIEYPEASRDEKLPGLGNRLYSS